MPRDPNSLVDFLKERRLASDVESRRRLWGQWNPLERYRASAEQNTQLLNALRLAEAAPQLEIMNSVVPANGEITARLISPTPVLIENHLLQTSTTAAPGATVTLGTADEFGLWAMHLRNDAASVLGQLVLLPQGDATAVGWWSTPVEMTEDSIMIPLPDPDFAEVVEQFLNHLPDVAESAAEFAAADLFKTINLPGLMFDVFAGVVIGLGTGGGGAVIYFSQQGFTYGLDFMAKFFERAIELAPQPTDPDDKATLKTLILSGLTIVRLGVSWREFKKTKDLCATLSALTTLGDWTVKRFIEGPNPNGFEVAGSVIRSAVNSQVAMVCGILTHKPTPQP